MSSFKPSVGASLKGDKLKLKAGLFNNGSIAKAMLIPRDLGIPTIEFMFNPNQLTFNGQVKISDSYGSRDDKGTPKVSFSYIEPTNVSIGDITYDTYESGENVVEKYIEPFQAALQFVDEYNKNLPLSVGGIANEAAKEVRNQLGKVKGGFAKEISDTLKGIIGEDHRPPIYRFVWGDQVYLRNCFIQSLTYKLTMFLPDGTPVRAVVSGLTLTQATHKKPGGDILAAVTDRLKDGFQAKLNVNSSFKL